MKKRLTVGILAGGKSAEHEVSLQSAKNVFDAIDRERFTPVLIGIDKNGAWRVPEQQDFLLNPDDPGAIRLTTAGSAAVLAPGSSGRLSVPGAPGNSIRLDVIFPILHGPFGEDGTVQGLLKLAEVPFVGSGVLGSALGMDKDVMKRLFRDSGIPIGKFITIRPGEKAPGYGEVVSALGENFFVKPANMGSSVGVYKVHSEAEYGAALEGAFRYDTKAVLEEFIEARELECSVLGNENPETSVPGEILLNSEFYSYSAKYLDEHGASLVIPAQIPAAKVKEIQALAVQAFQALDCAGFARVDFFMRNNGSLLVNEINTIPGFTRISMYPKLWEASGVSYTALITRLIELALERFEKEKKLKTSFL